MPTSYDSGQKSIPRETGRGIPLSFEFGAIMALVGLALFLLKVSWRKWPDPIVDFGPQCYAAWRLSDGANLYHDFAWNYGPLSVHVYSLLFKCFGPGIMVLASGNLVVYLGIAILGYVIFRKAWGAVGAITALGVFISVFSFSHLTGVGNYNYVTPYSVETIHGMLVLLASLLFASSWIESKSNSSALAMGLCFGLSLVLKPEFILAIAIISGTTIALKWMARKPISLSETLLFVVASLIPTIFFTLYFSVKLGLIQGFIDASQAWWLVLVDHIQTGDKQQSNFTGANNPLMNLLLEGKATLIVSAMAGLLIAMGLPSKRRLGSSIHIGCWAICILLIALGAKCFGGWLEIGACFPILLTLIVGWKLIGRYKSFKNGRISSPSENIALLILIAALAMLARMLLQSRIYHFGYFQSALAGMSLAAMATTELPRLVSDSVRGRNLTLVVVSLALVFGCYSIIAKNLVIRADQIESVATVERDHFYSTIRNLNPSGALVNWAVEQLNKTETNCTVMVFPEGMMVNYLARRKTMEPGWMRGMSESQVIERMNHTPPDYVIFMSRDIREFGITMFGGAGNLGFDIATWARDHYDIQSGWGEDPLAKPGNIGIFMMKRKPNGIANPPVKL